MDSFGGLVHCMSMLKLYLFLFAGGFVVAAIHAMGHFFAGRMCGIPFQKMRIKLLWTPQMMIRDGDAWIGPGRTLSDADEYLSVFNQLMRSRRALFCYVSGGFLGQSVVTIALWTIVTVFEVHLYGLVFASLSMAIFLGYIFVYDLPYALVHGYPRGNVSALWWISPSWTMSFASIVLAIHLALVVISAVLLV